jgi:hypothetical protein
MKKLKHEAALFKAALLAGVKSAEGRKAVEFEPTDSASHAANPAVACIHPLLAPRRLGSGNWPSPRPGCRLSSRQSCANSMTSSRRSPLSMLLTQD